MKKLKVKTVPLDKFMEMIDNPPPMTKKQRAEMNKRIKAYSEGKQDVEAYKKAFGL